MSSSHRFRSTKFVSVKMLMFSYLSVLTFVLSAQKNRLIQTVLLRGSCHLSQLLTDGQMTTKDKDGLQKLVSLCDR